MTLTPSYDTDSPSSTKLFYTVNAVFPVLAAVEELDAPTYERLDLDGVNENVEVDGEASLPQDKINVEPRAVSYSLRSMIRVLYSIRKWFPLVRGFGWHSAWNIVKLATLFAAYKLPPTLGFLAQIFLPLPFASVHTLWVHTLLSRPSTQPLSKRLVPFKTTLKAVILPMSTLLTGEAVMQRVLWYTYIATEMKWENFFPMGSDHNKAVWFCLLLAVLTLVLIVPAHLFLIRVEASLLPADEVTIIALDAALTGGQGERGYMTLVDAWRSATKERLVTLSGLYMKIFIITAGLVAVVGFVDFTIYIVIALQSWRF